MFGFVPNMYGYRAIVPKYITAWLASFLSLFELTNDTLGRI